MRRSTQPSAGCGLLFPHQSGLDARHLVRSAMGLIALLLPGFLLAQTEPATQGDKQPAAAPAAKSTAVSKARAQMAIDKPLVTLEEDAKLSRLRFKIGQTLRQGTLTNDARQQIDEWARWRLYRMTITEIPKKKRPDDPDEPEPIPYRRRLAEFNRELLQDIRGAAKFQNNPAVKEEFRKYVLDRVIARAMELMDNNYYVRLNVVMLISRLNLIEANIGKDDAIPYTKISAPLLTIIRDKDQDEAVKIAALYGLRRVLQRGRAGRDQKNEIALELMEQLKHKASMYWYPMKLIEALGRVDEPLIARNNLAGVVPVQLPFHVQALVVAMRDDDRSWLERSEAAKSLGRISMHASVDSGLVCYEIVVFTHEMAAAYNKNRRKFYWQGSFLNVYLTFKPINEQEAARVALVKPATLISKFGAQKAVGDAYQQILPVVKHVVNQPVIVNNKRVNQPIPKDAIELLAAWIKENKPSSDRIAPGLPLLEQAQPMAARTDAARLPAVLGSD